MNSERWGKIESIFHKALEVDAGRRGSVLEESCAGDDALRREVESLLLLMLHGLRLLDLTG